MHQHIIVVYAGIIVELMVIYHTKNVPITKSVLPLTLHNEMFAVL